MAAEKKLSQAEIDDLIAMLASGASMRREPEAEVRSTVERYDFRQVRRLNRDQLRLLARANKTFADSLATHLIHRVRVPLQIDASMVHQTTYSEFISLVPNPCLLATVEVVGRDQIFVLQFNLGLLFFVYERLCGGTGSRTVLDRELSDVELAVLRRHLLDPVLESLQRGWEEMGPVKLRLQQIESNPGFVSLNATQEHVVVITFETRIGNASDTFNLCIPQDLVEHLLPSTRRRAVVERSREPTEQEAAGLRSGLFGTRVKVQVPIGKVQMSVRDLLDLRPGDIICFPQPVDQDLEIHVAGVPKYRGRPGTVRDHIAVVVTGRYEGEDDR